MPEVSEIGSNLKRATDDYDADLPTPVVTNPLPYDESAEHSQLIDEEAKLFAENYAARRQYRWQGQERWMGRENEEKRLVNILHPHAVFAKLKAAGVDCSIEPALVKVWDIDHSSGLQTIKEKTRSNARFWLHDKAILGRVGISAWVWQDGKRVAKLITSLQYPCGPEWSVMRFDEFDVPTVEKYRGWRTAMLALIQAEVLTEEEVERAFGRATEDDVAELWWASLEAHRAKPRGEKR
jgi:hypothetical protein